MAHLWNRPIEPPEFRNGHIYALRFRDRHLVRQVLDAWTDRGAWWEGEREKHFFRVETLDGGIYELYSESAMWFIYKSYD